jgi:hypothetical protein
MYSFTEETQPWKDYLNDIDYITIDGGLTTIGNYAFSNFPKITTLLIPEGIISIGNYSIYNNIQFNLK